MSGIYEIKSGVSTKEFTLDYDSTKDKYYLNICAYGELWTESFFGDYALKEYLRTDWNFEDEQIKGLLNNINLIGLGVI